ncbi:MAG: ORF6N domain-containing protein [Acutalibacteraceae bacterium]
MTASDQYGGYLCQKRNRFETKYLNRQRSRNADSFPKDFCFRLSKEEYEILR